MPYSFICEAHAPPKQRNYMRDISTVSTKEIQKDLDFISEQWGVFSTEADMRQALVSTITKRLVWGASK